MTERVFIFIVPAVPSPFSGGGDLTVIGIIEAIAQFADRIVLMPLNRMPDRDIRDYLHSHSDTTLEIDYFLEHLGFLKTITTSALSYAVMEKFRDVRPEMVMAYHFPASRYLKYFQPSSKTVALLGDPPYLPFYYGEKLRNAGISGFRALIKRFRDRQYINKLKKRIRTDLVGSNYIFAFASHHATDFAELTGRSVSYIHTPIPTGLGYSCSTTINWKRKEPSKIFEVLHIGHLSGTATLSGLLSLADYCDKVNCDEQLRIKISVVGGRIEKLPIEVRRVLDRSHHISFHGETNDPRAWFDQADFLLVPIDVPLGIRVRILAAMSMGCAVIAHKANSLGIPELSDGHNCRLYSSSEELVSVFRSLAADPSNLMRIRVGGHALYKSLFNPVSFASELEALGCKLND